VPDNYPGCGPLAGLEAGLSAATHAVCFVAACDMPFINVDSVLFLIESAEGYDAAIPRIDGRWHPLYAVYRKACVAQAREMLSKGCYRMTDLLAGLKIRTISADELEQFSSGLKMLANLNMPEEWQKLQRMPGLNCVNTSSVKGL
jgi:molybdopterin-guanine dinucleotide biosynthesis protein A